MRLFDLLNGIELIKSNISLDIEVEYIANDHRKVRKNTVFVAIKGTCRNGNNYIDSALENGATAIITDQACEENFSGILVKDARACLSKMWSNFYGNPSRGVKTAAITGTNGKTSSAFFLYSILNGVSADCALISTVGCYLRGEKLEIDGGSVSDIASAMTTPDPEALYYLYNKMKESGIKIAVIEASSHALAQKRLYGIEIEIGIFTNLSREHLDFHGSIEEYFSAKEELFKICKRGIVNIDNIYGKRIKEKYENVYGISIKEKSDFFAQSIELSEKGCEYRLLYGDNTVDIRSGVIGEFTVYNTAIAASCAILLGIDKCAITDGIKSLKSIRGRLEKYRDKSIYIDYAHTPEAMKNAILSVRRIDKEKRLIVLFGCGGDRDRGKRAEMGEIASKYADYTVITSDNPRSEEPIEIIEEILLGFDKRKTFSVIENRKEAIEKTAKELKNNEVLLLLGKGHEEYEITKEGKRHFSEREVLDGVFLIDK